MIMQAYELENSKKIIVVVASADNSFSTAEIAEAIATMAKCFCVAIEFVENGVRALTEMFNEMKACSIELFENIKDFHEKEAEREYHRALHKLDFTRKKIAHQVMCRKPKHLVKKIIR